MLLNAGNSLNFSTYRTFRDMIEKAAKEVPYVFSVPETYEELTGD
jgi:hypothetical protein